MEGDPLLGVDPYGLQIHDKYTQYCKQFPAHTDVCAGLKKQLRKPKKPTQKKWRCVTTCKWAPKDNCPEPGKCTGFKYGAGEENSVQEAHAAGQEDASTKWPQYTQAWQDFGCRLKHCQSECTDGKKILIYSNSKK